MKGLFLITLLLAKKIFLLAASSRNDFENGQSLMVSFEQSLKERADNMSFLESRSQCQKRICLFYNMVRFLSINYEQFATQEPYFLFNIRILV